MTYATKARTLDDIAADSHVFSIIAMDQRNTLRRMFTTVARPRLERLIEVAEHLARPWTDVAINHQAPE